jgi:hypothetical protein
LELRHVLVFKCMIQVDETQETVRGYLCLTRNHVLFYSESDEKYNTVIAFKDVQGIDLVQENSATRRLLFATEYILVRTEHQTVRSYSSI